MMSLWAALLCGWEKIIHANTAMPEFAYYGEIARPLLVYEAHGITAGKSLSLSLICMYYLCYIIW